MPIRSPLGPRVLRSARPEIAKRLPRLRSASRDCEAPPEIAKRLPRLRSPSRDCEAPPRGCEAPPEIAKHLPEIPKRLPRFRSASRDSGKRLPRFRTRSGEGSMPLRRPTVGSSKNIGETRLATCDARDYKKAVIPARKRHVQQALRSTANARASRGVVARKAVGPRRDRARANVTRRGRRFANTTRSTPSFARQTRSGRCVAARCTRRFAKRS